VRLRIVDQARNCEKGSPKIEKDPQSKGRGSVTGTTPLKLVLVGMIYLISHTTAVAMNHPARTGTGGGPETTITAPHVAPTGRVIPRPQSSTLPAAGEAGQKPEPPVKDSFLMKDICVGC
jgi:hypothetical protein